MQSNRFWETYYWLLWLLSTERNESSIPVILGLDMRVPQIGNLGVGSICERPLSVAAKVTLQTLLLLFSITCKVLFNTTFWSQLLLDWKGKEPKTYLEWKGEGQKNQPRAATIVRDQSDWRDYKYGVFLTLFTLDTGFYQAF